MNYPAVTPSVSLADALAHHARVAPPLRLALDIGTGVVVLAAAIFWRPAAWFVLACAALCFAMFGIWGVADRSLDRFTTHDRQLLAGVLRIARVAAATVGVLAAATMLLSLAGSAMGVWIS
jgi:hypothetical protein